ncbi:MAG: EamA family transporter [Acidimicrobiales bacterium]
MRQRFPAWGLLVVSSLSVQSGAALARHLFDYASPAGVSLVRLALAAVALLALWRPMVRRRGRGDLALAAAFGVVLGAMNLSFYEALDRAPLGVVVTVELLGPLGVAIAGARRRRSWVWAALALGGVALLTSAPRVGRASLVGLALAASAACCWAGYILLAARVGRRFRGGEGLALAMAVGAAAVAPLGILETGSRLATPTVLLGGLVVALASSVVPYSLEMEALRRIPAGLFGMLMAMEPAIAAMIGWAALGQRLAVAQWCAVGCVALACIGATRDESTAGQPRLPPLARALPRRLPAAPSRGRH